MSRHVFFRMEETVRARGEAEFSVLFDRLCRDSVCVDRVSMKSAGGMNKRGSTLCLQPCTHC